MPIRSTTETEEQGGNEVFGLFGNASLQEIANYLLFC